jgi:acyl carrier protein
VDTQDIVVWIQTWVSERRSDPSVVITEETDLYKSGLLDSLGIIELIESLEDEFELMFTEEQMQDGLTAAADFAKVILDQA